MEPEISVAAAIFEGALRLADELDLSLSDLFVAALAAYVAARQAGGVTGRLNEVYAKEASGLELGLVAIQVRAIEG